jgi:hypothetical protein
MYGSLLKKFTGNCKKNCISYLSKYLYSNKITDDNNKIWVKENINWRVRKLNEIKSASPNK